MANLEASIEIGNVAGEVFAYVTAPERMPIWMSNVVSVTRTSPEALRVGTIFHQRWKLLGRLLETTYAVLEHDPPRAFADQGITGPVCCFVRCSFAPLARGTRRTGCGDLDLRAIYHQQALLAARVARRLLEADLLTLEAVLERQ